VSRREDIDNSIWSDSDFLKLSANAKLVYLWSFTNPRCGMSGLYKVDESIISFDTKIPPAKLAVALSELARTRFAYYDDGVIFVRTRVRHLRQKTQPIAKSIASDLRMISDSHPLQNAFVQEYGHAAWLQSAVFGEGHGWVTGGSTDRPVSVKGTGKGTGTGSRGSNLSVLPSSKASDETFGELRSETRSR
jgi:hypothetical protein